MQRILRYSVLLILGMIAKGLWSSAALQPFVITATMTCLAYIMIEVGLEFVIEKDNLRAYGWDYVVAMTAAAFPWIFCTLYLYWVFGGDLRDSLLVGRFAAPTSAGILFAMLTAAGLGTTWLFKKVRILAIFDDLDTILFMIPLQIMFVGFVPEIAAILGLILLLFFLAYRYLHQLKVPVKSHYLLLYGFLVVLFCLAVELSFHVAFEVLLPAFALGCILYNPYDLEHVEEKNIHRHKYVEPPKRSKEHLLDHTIKHTFMFLVGYSLPEGSMTLGDIPTMAGHVIIITILSNLGKMFPTFCYQKEATLRERLGVSISMFPRGEVGAGILLLATEYGIQEEVIAVATLSLALNLLLTGVFIGTVIKLIEPVYNGKKNK